MELKPKETVELGASGAEPSISPEKTRLSGHASWLSAMLLFAPLSLFGEFLITRTHHRPLGAATWASAAILLWIFAEVTSRLHLDGTSGGAQARNRKIAWGLCGVVNSVVLVRVFL